MATTSHTESAQAGTEIDMTTWAKLTVSQALAEMREALYAALSRTQDQPAADQVGEDAAYEAAWNKYRWMGGPGYTDSSASTAFLEGWNAALAARPASPAPTPSPESTLEAAQVAAIDGGGARTLAEACKPWEFHVGEPPDDDSPLLAVYNAGLTYAFELLAKDLGVESYHPCDGTETWEGDVAGTMHNILVAGGIICDETGARAVLPALATTPASAGEGELREVKPDRAAFEKWISGFGFPSRLSHRGNYENSHTVMAWNAWQASLRHTLTLALARPAAPAVDVPAERERLSHISKVIDARLSRGVMPGYNFPADWWPIIAEALRAILAKGPTDPGGARGWVEDVSSHIGTILHVTDFPKHKREDAEFLRGVICCARDYAKAAEAALPAASTASSDAGGAANV